MPESLSYNDLISSVVDKLLSNFSSEIPTIYKDTPIQGMVKPCFFIQQLTITYTKEMLNNGVIIYFLDIRAHPPESEDNKITWCNKVGFKLIETLDSITIKNQLIRASSTRYEIQDNVLHYFVQYSLRVSKELPNKPIMNTLETRQTLDYNTRR